MATNRRLVDFDGADFYPTPEWATMALLDFVPLHGSIIEPCCGDGAISKVIERRNNTSVVSSDLFDRGYGSVRNAFTIEEPIDNLVTNPPFALAEELILHFQPLVKKRMVFLLRTAFLESARRHRSIFSKFPPQEMLVFSERLSMYPAGQRGVKGGGTTSYAWFIWDMSHDVQATTIVKWIPPGYKPRGR
jgi:hypothetical protein